MGKQITLNNVRINWPKLFTATQFKGQGAYKYEATFIMEKGDASDRAISTAVEEAMGASRHTGKFKTSYYEGAEEYPNDAFHADKTFIRTAKLQSQGAPIVMKPDNTPMSAMEAGTIYSGCYVNAIVDCYTPKDYPERVSFALVAVQLVKDGERLDGAPEIDADTLFKPLGEDEAGDNKPGFL